MKVKKISRVFFHEFLFESTSVTLQGNYNFCTSWILSLYPPLFSRYFISIPRTQRAGKKFLSVFPRNSNLCEFMRSTGSKFFQNFLEGWNKRSNCAIRSIDRAPNFTRTFRCTLTLRCPAQPCVKKRFYHSAREFQTEKLLQRLSSFFPLPDNVNPTAVTGSKLGGPCQKL